MCYLLFSSYKDGKSDPKSLNPNPLGFFKDSCNAQAISLTHSILSISIKIPQQNTNTQTNKENEEENVKREDMYQNA